MTEHKGQGCLPSKVVSIASDTEVAMERETSIPVHAVVCKTTQCAPLRYSAQQRIRSLCRDAFTVRLVSMWRPPTLGVKTNPEHQTGSVAIVFRERHRASGCNFNRERRSEAQANRLFCGGSHGENEDAPRRGAQAAGLGEAAVRGGSSPVSLLTN